MVCLKNTVIIENRSFMTRLLRLCLFYVRFSLRMDTGQDGKRCYAVHGRQVWSQLVV